MRFVEQVNPGGGATAAGPSLYYPHDVATLPSRLERILDEPRSGAVACLHADHLASRTGEYPDTPRDQTWGVAESRRGAVS